MSWRDLKKCRHPDIHVVEPSRVIQSLVLSRSETRNLQPLVQPAPCAMKSSASFASLGSSPKSRKGLGTSATGQVEPYASRAECLLSILGCRKLPGRFRPALDIAISPSYIRLLSEKTNSRLYELTLIASEEQSRSGPLRDNCSLHPRGADTRKTPPPSKSIRISLAVAQPHGECG